MRLYIGRSSETGPLSPYPFCRVFIIDRHGYDFRKGHTASDKKVRDSPAFESLDLGEFDKTAGCSIIAKAPA